MGELFNMLLSSFQRGDDVFVEKGLDLFLSRIKSGKSPVVPQAVNGFLESLFDPGRDIGNLSVYAQAAGISENYLSRQVRQSTGHSVGHWIDNARLVRAKRLLADTSLPIIEVATEVGLEDHYPFLLLYRLWKTLWHCNFPLLPLQRPRSRCLWTESLRQYRPYLLRLFIKTAHIVLMRSLRLYLDYTFPITGHHLLQPSICVDWAPGWKIL